jgi:hypothetical protein
MASAASASKHAERQQACRVQQSWRSTGGPPVVPWWLARWSAIDCVYGASPHHDPPPTSHIPNATSHMRPPTCHTPHTTAIATATSTAPAAIATASTIAASHDAEPMSPADAL